MRTWFTSDLHFGHENIIKYCARPYRDVDEMNQDLIRRWNDVVSDHDTVWVLGDFAMGDISDTLTIAADLRGHKILLAGNHDRCWTGRRESAEAWTERYLESGFAEVRQGVQSLTINGHRVDLCHFPYVGDSHDKDRYIEHRPVDHGGWLLHGHVHERWRQRDRMINVGVDANSYAPLGEDEVARMMEAGPADISAGSEVSGGLTKLGV